MTAATGSEFELNAKIKLHYEVTGHGPEKVILINGVFGNTAIFADMIEVLSQFPDFEIITCDHRGTGKSTGITDETLSSSLLAKDLLALLVHRGYKKVHVYGQSMGGMVAQELALLLHAKGMLASLYLAVSSRGEPLRPMALLGPAVLRRLPVLVGQRTQMQMTEQLLATGFGSGFFSSPDTPDPETGLPRINSRQYWIDKFSAPEFHTDPEVVTRMMSVANSHYVSDERFQPLIRGDIPRCVCIAKEDKLLHPDEQEDLQAALACPALVLEKTGHMHFAVGDNQSGFYRSLFVTMRRAFLTARPDLQQPPPPASTEVRLSMTTSVSLDSSSQMDKFLESSAKVFLQAPPAPEPLLGGSWTFK